MLDEHIAYFVHCGGHICCYNSATKRWSELPQCLYVSCSLAVIRGLLTAIGGMTENKLVSIVNDQDKKWVEHFPPMPTKRHSTAAVTTKQHLIVAGGMVGFCCLNTVEVMDTETLVWSTAANLTLMYCSASATICGDHLYILGGNVWGGPTKSVLTCSLTKLLQSCGKASSGSVWSSIADVPVYHSTCATISGELVAVGGLDEEGKATAAVHRYNPTSDTWHLISNMPTARKLCLVAVLLTNEVIIVGGNTSIPFRELTDQVELASIIS